MTDSTASITPTEPATTKRDRDIIAQLRLIADLIEEHNLDIRDWVTVSVANSLLSDYSLSDEDFKRLFNGASVSGYREGNWIKVKAERFGVTFSTNIYSPITPKDASITLTI